MHRCRHASNFKAPGFWLICAAIFFITVFSILLYRGEQYARKKQSLSSLTVNDMGESENEQPIPESDIWIKVYDAKNEQVIDMEIEEYLLGVVAAEMPVSFDLEALKAQAVAARTYTVKKMVQYGGSGCKNGSDICTDSSCCQAYISLEKRQSNWGNNAAQNESVIRLAVEQTKGELVLYDNQPIEAFFHSTSGGMTEASENAFSQALPYLRSVVSDEESAPKYEGSVEVARKEFVDTINNAYPDAKLKASNLEKTVYVVDYFESGRANKIQLGNTQIDAKRLRTLFSLDSTNIQFEFTENSVIMHTKGYGHGVGLSQTGADQMAKSGSSYRDILLYYYVDTTIQKLW